MVGAQLGRPRLDIRGTVRAVSTLLLLYLRLMEVQGLGTKKTQREANLLAEHVLYASCLAIVTTFVLRL